MHGFFGLGVARFQLGQEDARQLADAGGVAEVILHEQLNRAPPRRIMVSHAGGHLDLHVKGQLIHRPTRDVMQMATRGPKKVFGAFELGIFLARQQTRPDQPRARELTEEVAGRGESVLRRALLATAAAARPDLIGMEVFSHE